jgi:hypothetical protein
MVDRAVLSRHATDMESHPPGNSLTYRPEIDGLRALAVVSVILYHAGTLIPGGYVGVDVFFVISGYLIASIVIREKERGTFRLTGFWERRLRRLFPAWIAMIVVTTVAALSCSFPITSRTTGSRSFPSRPSPRISISGSGAATSSPSPGGSRSCTPGRSRWRSSFTSSSR